MSASFLILQHNDENGEKGRDGCNDNFSWNCGHEGHQMILIKNVEITVHIYMDFGFDLSPTCYRDKFHQLSYLL